MAEVYDVLIVGGGPAGLTAGLYASRSRLKTLLVERGLFGGQITSADRVENFPGFPQGITGPELGERMHQQATLYGLETQVAEVTGVEIADDLKRVDSDHGSFRGRALVIASGSQHRKLGVPGEEELVGRGVSYCATCDAPFFQGREVAVVGGGDVALAEALYLARFASRVHIIHRRREFRASAILQEQVRALPRMDLHLEKVVTEVLGQEKVQGLRLKGVARGEEGQLAVAGVFVAIGLEPNTAFLGRWLPLTPTGHIVTNSLMETPVPGVLASGDVRQDSARQAITAAGDGATAALSALGYLRSQGR